MLIPPEGLVARSPLLLEAGQRRVGVRAPEVEAATGTLLDFSGDLYDERVAVRFVARLRGEVKFDSVDDLIAQMHRDCDDARRLLAI